MIIGAGPAGLFAAYKLAGKCDVTILDKGLPVEKGTALPLTTAPENALYAQNCTAKAEQELSLTAKSYSALKLEAH